MKKRLACIVCMLSMIFSSLLTGTSQVYAKTEEIQVPGLISILDGKGKYTGLTNFKKIDDTVQVHGRFVLKAKIADSNENGGLMEYGLNSKATFSYYYDNDNEEIYKEDGKKVDTIKTDSKIGKGVLILETSKNNSDWNVSYVKTNLLNELPTEKTSFYTTSDVELASGYYYRVTVAYTYKRSDVYTSVKERYKFYLYNSAITKSDDENAAKQTLGTKTKTGKSGYTGDKEIENNDCHYGWDLGKFFVSGYTTSTVDASGTPIFLKNQSDKISLWFNLAQDIDKLNQKKALSIVEDEGYDQYFETKKMDLGRGALIIRYTDYENVKQESKVYTNFLEENAILGKDQRIQFLGEGDYEVALDYEVKNDKRNIFGLSVLPEYSYYRIYFKFSVRNADSNVRLYDVNDNTKLKTNDSTENGFELNQKLSRYLDVEVKHEIYDAEKNSFTEDKNLKTNAKNGGKYTDEGFYLITAKNRYTDSQTNRIVYVGKNAFLQECAQSGMMPDEIVQYVKTELEKKEEESRQAAEAAAKRKEEQAAEESLKAAPESAIETTQVESISLEESTGQKATSKKGEIPIRLIVVMLCVIGGMCICIRIFLAVRNNRIEKEKEKARNYLGPLMTNLEDDIEDDEDKR